MGSVNIVAIRVNQRVRSGLDGDGEPGRKGGARGGTGSRSLTAYERAFILAPETMWLDLAVFRWMNGQRHPLLDGALGVVSGLGEVSAVWLLACGIMFFFGAREHKRAAVVLLVTLLILDGMVGGTIKGLWPRPRPYLALAGVNAWGIAWETASFPSGHAYSSALAAVVWGAKFRRALVPLGIFCGLTCYARPYFGMHYPSDVLGGAALGLVGGVLALRVEEAWERERRGARPGWWIKPSGWGLFFSLIGVEMLVAKVAGGRTQPLGVLALGFVLGLLAWLREGAGSRKWVGMVASVIGLLGLGIALAQLLR